MVAPVLQVKVPKQPVAVKVVLCPEQMNAFVVVITGTSAGATVIFILAVPEHDAVPQITEYVVEFAGVTLIVFPVCPVFQVTLDVQFETVSVTEVPAQTELEDAVSVGA